MFATIHTLTISHLCLEPVNIATLELTDHHPYDEICRRLEGLNVEYDRFDSACAFLQTAPYMRNTVFSAEDVDRLGTNIDLFLTATALLLMETRDFIVRLR